MDLKYSVDMVRFKIKLPFSEFEYFQKTYLEYNPHVDYWENTSYKNYRHNWRIKQQNNGYWLGYQHNMEVKSEKGKYSLVLEYNPNKCDYDEFLNNILTRFYKGDWVELVSVDVAIDIPININDLIIDKYKKKKCKIFDNGGDDKTYYLGEGDNRIKIYNKARELGIAGDLTRYEVSAKVSTIFHNIAKYDYDAVISPIGYIKNIEEVDDTLKAVLFAVNNGYEIQNLSRRMRENIRKVITDTSEIFIDKKMISSTIRRWLKGYRQRMEHITVQEILEYPEAVI